MELKQNIADTIGFCYELIIIDNSKNEHNIFSAYNEGVKQSRGDILCFMHEDILYHTNNWGRAVINLFEDNNSIGLCGVVGTHYMPKYASPWWASSALSGQLMQGNIYDGEYVCFSENFLDRRNANTIEAVIVDGLWMCIRRSMFDDKLIKFDNESFNGFHCYDADICMQVIKSGYEVRVAYDVLIEHKSLGCPDVRYFKQLDIWYEKWKDMLPLIKGIDMSDIERDEREQICKRYTELFKTNEVLIERLNNIYNSNAYKVGKTLVKPFKILMSVIKTIGDDFS